MINKKNLMGGGKRSRGLDKINVILSLERSERASESQCQKQSLLFGAWSKNASAPSFKEIFTPTSGLKMTVAALFLSLVFASESLAMCAAGSGGCETCSADGSKCVACKSYYSLKNNGCVYCGANAKTCHLDENGNIVHDTCFNRYNLKDGICTACYTPGGAATCHFDGNGNTVHDTCQDGYAMKNGVCTSCSNASTCHFDENEKRIDEICNSGYSMKNGVCTYCGSGRAETCHWDSSGKTVIDSCTGDSYLKDGVCTSCGSGVASCHLNENGNVVHDSCQNSSTSAYKYAPKDGVCTRCNDNNNSVASCHFDANGNQVHDTCITGYALKNGVCTSCHGAFQTLCHFDENGNGVQDACPTHNILENGKCTSCGGNVSSCHRDENGNIVIDTCSTGYGIKNNACARCNDGGSSCHWDENENEITDSCKNNQYLKNGRCYNCSESETTGSECYYDEQQDKVMASKCSGSSTTLSPGGKCINCGDYISNCYTCTYNDEQNRLTCTQCNGIYYSLDATGACVYNPLQWPEGCANEDCSRCSPFGYYRDNKDAEQPCKKGNIEGCYTYSTSSYCQECLAAYDLSGGKCTLREQGDCPTGKVHAKNSTSCDYCAAGYVKDGSNCITEEECQNKTGYYVSPDAIPTCKYNTGYARCEELSAKRIYSSSNSYSTQTLCTKCKDGYYMSPTGGGCTEASGCPKNYYANIETGVCEKKPDGCSNFDTDGNCLDETCWEGYNKDENGVCALIPEGCTRMEDNICVGCKTGYFKNKIGDCEPYPQGCTAVSNEACVSCTNGYLEKNGKCIGEELGCGDGYKNMGGYCNKIRYTPAEAAKLLRNDNTNQVIITFKK